MFALIRVKHKFTYLPTALLNVEYRYNVRLAVFFYFLQQEQYFNLHRYY